VFDLPAPEFCLRTTLASGQAFRWQTLNGWSYGVLGRHVLKVRQDADQLRCDTSHPSLDADTLRRYFALDLDLPLRSAEGQPQTQAERYRQNC